MEEGLTLTFLITLLVISASQSDSQGSTENGAFIQLRKVPEYLRHDLQVELRYRCSQAQRYGFIVYTPTHLNPSLVAFTYSQRCEPSRRVDNDTVRVLLPRKLAYRPGHHNKISVTAKSASLLLWIIDEALYSKAVASKSYYEFARVRHMHNIKILAPYERPDAPLASCPTWWHGLELAKPYTPKCPYEHTVYHAVDFPLALAGTRHGLHRAFPSYHNKVLQQEHINNLSKPRFTISLWLYVEEYCPEGAPLCSIVQHLTWDDRYMTPLVYINQLGNLHLQVVSAQGEALAHLWAKPMPRYQWCHLVLSFNIDVWKITLLCPKDKNKPRIFRENKLYIEKNKVIWYEDTAELMVLGGSEVCPSFRGYIARALFYRNAIKSLNDIPDLGARHLVHELNLGQESEVCVDLLTWLKDRIYQVKVLLQISIEKRSCPSINYSYSSLFNIQQSSNQPYCQIYKGPKPADLKFLSSWIKREVYEGRTLRIAEIGRHLYEEVAKAISEEGLDAIPKAMKRLRQASCYGNHDASYMLAVLYNNGFGVRSEEKLAQWYLFKGAMHQHRLSLMSIAHKHRHGLDGFSHDSEQAYVYLKYAADLAREDRESHKQDDMFMERVRLTDDVALEAQTDEDGDLFQWFRHQASQGAVHAQRNLARLYFWGSQGIQRNLERAVEYYRLGARSMDPDALYDYGIVLLKGIGVKKNITAAMIQLEKAASKGHVQAINAVGWHALEITKNYTKAREYFLRSYKLGSPDAAHNLGHMYLSGIMPNTTGPDRVQAFQYFSEGAKRGQVDSSVMVALYNMRGHPVASRNVYLAVEWSRFVAEQSGYLGRTLSTAVKSYRKGNWVEAILYYMLAAETGVEVGCFNLAHLCEVNKDYITSFIEKDCVWRYYNLSTLRDFQHVDPYAWIKMGDYWWYGCQGRRNPLEAALLYGNAALHGDPHALFNLGYLLEEGIYIPDKVWRGLNFPEESLQSNITLLTEIYSRCKESTHTEAYLPCSLALLRLNALYYWDKYHLVVKFSSVLGTVAITTLTLTSFYNYLHHSRQSVNNV